MTGVALIDIDGVIADDRHRVPFALRKEWVEYFAPERVSADGVWLPGKDLVSALSRNGVEIRYLTGRREDLRPVTEAWLRDNGFPDGPLYMKPFPQEGVENPTLAKYKADKIQALRAAEGRHFVLYDDDPEVVRYVRLVHGDYAATQPSWNVKDPGMVKQAVA